MRTAYTIVGISILIIAGTWAYLRFMPAPGPAAGDEQEQAQNKNSNTTPMNPSPVLPFSLKSSAFTHGMPIPAAYTCEGANSPPPLTISGIPAGAKSLVLVMHDPDVPKELVPEGVFYHWIIYNIPPDGSLKGAPGANNRDELAYTGPCPPGNYEPTTHRYIFTLYALSGRLNFMKPPTAEDVIEAVKGMTIGEAELIGTYSRK